MMITPAQQGSREYIDLTVYRILDYSRMDPFVSLKLAPPEKRDAAIAEARRIYHNDLQALRARTRLPGTDVDRSSH